MRIIDSLIEKLKIYFKLFRYGRALQISLTELYRLGMACGTHRIDWIEAYWVSPRLNPALFYSAFRGVAWRTSEHALMSSLNSGYPGSASGKRTQVFLDLVVLV